MATTAIWDVRDNLSRVIDYTSNPNKTEKQTDADYQFNGLSQVISYTTHDLKTEKQLYVTGINCSLETVKRDMITTKKQYQKENGILAYHAYQSFAKGETDAETAHQIGIELANTLWGNRFEVLISTHLDKDHYHNHFVINSVSFKDGLRYYDNKESYKKMRNISDLLCKKYHLSVIEQPVNKSLSYNEWKMMPTIRLAIKTDVDYAISHAMTFKQFISLMEKMGYKFKFNKHIAVLPPHGKKYIRLRSLDNNDNYTEEAIRRRIFEISDIQFLSNKGNQKNIKIFHYNGNIKKAKKITGFRALYFRYMYAMGILPKNAPNKKRVHFLLHEDLKYLDRISSEAILLCKKKISTIDELESHLDIATSRKENLIRERRCVYNKIRRCHNSEKKEMLQQDIKLLTSSIREATKEIKLYENIKLRSVIMKEKLDQINSQNKKISQKKINKIEKGEKI